MDPFFIPKKKRKLYISCIKDFFFKTLPKIKKYSTNEAFKEKHGDFHKIGIEGALEACIAVFEEGRLRINAKNIKDYIVYYLENDVVHILHDAKEIHEKDRNA